LLAWVGIPVINDRRFGIHGWVDLADPKEREKIAEFAARSIDDYGFDGVHLNVEHVDNNDPNYLLLLEEVRKAIAPEHMLSVASNDWLPAGLNRIPIVGGYKWDGSYYRAVAARVDQIVTMTYDSFMPWPALYRLWLREQVIGISRSLSDSDVQLLIGVSVSRENTRTHHPKAENMQSGMSGVCAGIARTDNAVQGIAVYAAWEANENDWQTWETWLVEGSPTH